MVQLDPKDAVPLDAAGVQSAVIRTALEGMPTGNLRVLRNEVACLESGFYAAGSLAPSVSSNNSCNSNVLHRTRDSGSFLSTRAVCLVLDGLLTKERAAEGLTRHREVTQTAIFCILLAVSMTPRIPVNRRSSSKIP